MATIFSRLQWEIAQIFSCFLEVGGNHFPPCWVGVRQPFHLVWERWWGAFLWFGEGMAIIFSSLQLEIAQKFPWLGEERGNHFSRLGRGQTTISPGWRGGGAFLWLGGTAGPPIFRIYNRKQLKNSPDWERRDTTIFPPCLVGVRQPFHVRKRGGVSLVRGRVGQPIFRVHIRK
jgi:hypothetical protein